MCAVRATVRIRIWIVLRSLRARSDSPAGQKYPSVRLPHCDETDRTDRTKPNRPERLSGWLFPDRARSPLSVAAFPLFSRELSRACLSRLGGLWLCVWVSRWLCGALRRPLSGFAERISRRPADAAA